ncbi:putative kinesin [Trypanosoma cruzi]|uniref:Putative kinesin n=2 Tax=Trypanosoma cruzi TaxID=5693 RepID=A0A2V2WH52_TRYCR|nr:putative kinesin [Trypanosoma cruzi]PWV07627.1 putative kinesin [Trypanosoma cruzi]
MGSDYPDDGHIFVCVRVRDVATVPGMAVNNTAPRRLMRENIKDAQRICVSTLENVVVLHDPRSIDDASCVARDADSVVQLLTSRSSGGKYKNLARKLLTSTATASYFEYDKCLNSMDADSMLQMPLIRDSDFIRPPEYGTQEDVYLSTAVHAVSAAVDGINSCVFAYGQTGSGKTFTLFGDTTCSRRDPGVVPRTIDDLFQRLEGLRREYQSNTETEYSYRVLLSFFEIYQNEVYCLLSRKGPLHVNFVRDVLRKEETMTIHNLQQQAVTSAEKAYPLLELGLRRRQTGETGMNARSSRSHAVVQFRVTQWRTNRITKESVELNATINLVDLAGSERQKTAKTDGKSRDEGIQINQSLATLARVINDISRGAKYVNYRDSLLTMVLKDNLGGNSKTFMIATIAPVSFCYQESCATLQYAKDVRKIRNRPTVNRTFQTRSNLLELNARLKEENEQLKRHVEFLTNKCNADMYDAESNAEDVTLTLEKATGMTKGCGAVSMRQGKDTAMEAVIAAPAVGASPLVITAHRKYASVGGIGGSCLQGGCVGVTSLTKEIVQFRIAEMLGRAQKSDAQPREGDHELGNKVDYGVIEFELVLQRSCEQRYWMRHIPSDDADAGLSDAVECHVNGFRLKSGERRQLQHGDVVSVFFDGLDDGSEQDLLTFHYVDINSLSRGGNSGAGVTTGDLSVTFPLSEVQSQENVDVGQLLRERAKLLEMLREQSRTIEYQCQREAESRSRMASMANAQHREKDVSPSPRPVTPFGFREMNGPAVTPQQASAAARAFYRSSVSPFIRYEHSVDSQRFEDCVQENQMLYKGVMERNATLEELARRLAELENGNASPKRSSPALASIRSGTLKNASPTSKRLVSHEVSESESDDKVSPSVSPVAAMSETHKDINAVMNHDGAINEEGQAALKEENALTADEILLKHRKDPGLEEFSGVHVYLSTSEGVRERYYAAKRERVLCERIWSLEEVLEDLRGELNLVESELRIAKDANTEHELRQAQMEDEMKEVSKALLDATEENATLLREMNSLETFLNRTEEALAEATAVNEAEIEKRFTHMAEEIRALKLLARMWKRRAMQRIALDFSDDKNHNKDEGGGEEVENMSGQVPWDDLRVESNVARAKKLLGERGNTATAVNTIDHFEKETAFESVVALEMVLAGLENENLRLIDDIRAYEGQLQGYKDLVERLRREKEQLEKQERNETNLTGDELQNFKTLYTHKCEELALAERQCADAAAKLKTAMQKNTVVKKKSVKNSDLLLQEQRRVIEARQVECAKLSAALASRDEELRSVMEFMRLRGANEEIDGFKDNGELRDRIEELLAANMDAYGGGSGYSAFPLDFQFPEEVVALIRVCLRIMMDRLKIELYVLNRQSLHKFGLLVPAVQLRPEAQFHSFMHELRQVVAEIAGKPQRLGGKWSVEESDVLSRLVDHRRRRAGNALNGLLIWYDHWDLSPKSEHVCYMELIRNMEHVMQMARMVRQESLVNTNATSTLRLMLPGKNGAPETAYVPSSSKDTSVTDSCRILERLSDKTKRSNLARVVGSSKLVSPIHTFQRSRTTACSAVSPRKGEMEAMFFARNTTTLTPLRYTKEGHSQQKLSSGKGTAKTESKFGRRATALVVPVSEGDVNFAASSVMAQHDSLFNFARNASTIHPLETEHTKPTAKVACFARAMTDVTSFAALAELCGGKSTHPPTPHDTPHVGGASSNRKKKKTAHAAPSGNSLRRTNTSHFTRTHTTGVPQLSSRISGGRSATGMSTRTNTGGSLDSPNPSMPSSVRMKPFYDPQVLKHLKQRSNSASNEMFQQQKQPMKLTPSKAMTGLAMPPRSPQATFSRAASTFGRTSMPLSEKATHTADDSNAAPSVISVRRSTSRALEGTPLREQPQQDQPVVPSLCFDGIAR